MFLDKKIIFLTGGANGIGRECAMAYAKEGAHVIIVDQNKEKATETIGELNGHHLAIQCDVSKANDIKQAIEKTLHKFGRIDAIHNNAGIATPSKAIHETTEKEWDDLINVNLKSVYLTTRYGFAALKASQGCILNTSSLVGEIGQEIHAAYSATKGGMNTLTKSMALDYAKDKIRVNAVCPAGIWTPMLRQWCSEQSDPSSIERYLDAIHPLGDCPEGDVIADTCVFLLSDKARFITGCILPVSGGAELGYRRTE